MKTKYNLGSILLCVLCVNEESIYETFEVKKIEISEKGILYIGETFQRYEDDCFEVGDEISEEVKVFAKESSDKHAEITKTAEKKKKELAKITTEKIMALLRKNTP
jgi:lipoate-protein ligase A